MWWIFSVAGIYVLLSIIGSLLGLALALPFVIIHFTFFDPSRKRPHGPNP